MIKTIKHLEIPGQKSVCLKTEDIITKIVQQVETHLRKTLYKDSYVIAENAPLMERIHKMIDLENGDFIEVECGVVMKYNAMTDVAKELMTLFTANPHMQSRIQDLLCMKKKSQKEIVKIIKDAIEEETQQ